MAVVPNQYAYPSTAPLTIGFGMGSGGSSYWFRGAMDEVAIYNTPLSQSQVANLCQHPNAVNDKLNGLKQGIGTPYPVPASAVLNIPVKDITGAVTLSVKGIDGRLLSTKTVTLSGSDNLLQINTSGLSTGLYILEVTFEGQKVSMHFSQL